MKKIPMLEKFAAQSLVEYEGELIFSKEKFAELIVRECANHCDLLLDHKISSEWSRGTHDCSRAIKKHFGVDIIGVDINYATRL
jgi:hypothetical protein